MNPTLLALEAAAQIGALDPKPCTELVTKPYRLVRVVDERGEIWIDPMTGQEAEVEACA